MSSIQELDTALHAWRNHRSQSAAAWLVQAHRPLVLRAVRHSGVPEEMHEDAAQEVFSQVFESLPRYTAQRPFARWLSVIARNTCWKLRRHWQHRRALSACFENAALDADEFTLTDHERRPDRALMRQELHASRQALIDALPERERTLIERHLHEENNATRSTASERTALSRARAKLRAHWPSKEGRFASAHGG
jgi:RNA polymerase sigma factor (sigma-70 family)